MQVLCDLVKLSYVKNEFIFSSSSSSLCFLQPDEH